MKLFPLPFVLALAGCSSVASYAPYVGDVVDPAALAADEKDCLVLALAYATPVDLSAIGAAAAKGAANNATGAAVNPLVPVLGAAGAATSTALSQLGILNDDQRKVFLRCLEHRGERSRAYDVIDPNL